MAKASFHNGGNGSGKVIHDDRSFIEKCEPEQYAHIDTERTEKNEIYLADGTKADKNLCLEDYYNERYSDLFQKALDAQNERYRKKGNYDRIKGIDDWKKGKNTATRQTILQVGSEENPARWKKNGEILDTDSLCNLLRVAFMELEKVMKDRLGRNYQPFYSAIHLDETTPHLHWEYSIVQDKNGVLSPSLEKGLEQCGIELPNPDEKVSRYNNRCMTFTAEMRETWEDILIDFGLDIERSEPSGRCHIKHNQGRAEKAFEKAEKLEEKVYNLEIKADELQSKVKTLKMEEQKLRGSNYMLELDSKILDKKIGEKKDYIEKLDAHINNLFVKLKDILMATVNGFHKAEQELDIGMADRVKVKSDKEVDELALLNDKVLHAPTIKERLDAAAAIKKITENEHKNTVKNINKKRGDGAR